MASLFEGFQSRHTVFSFEDDLETSSTGSEFAIDVTESFVTNLKGSLSSFPIEGGGNISDHFQAAPLRVNLKGLITVSPSQQLLTLASSLLNGAIENNTQRFKGLSSTFVSAALTAGAAQVLKNSQKDYKKDNANTLLTNRTEVDPDFPKRAMLGLIKLFEAGTPFTIRSYFETSVYTNMVITALSFTHNSSVGDSLSFNMSAQKINIVKRSQISASSELKMADPISSSAAEIDAKGKTTKEAGSLLSQGFDKGSDLLKGFLGN